MLKMHEKTGDVLVCAIRDTTLLFMHGYTQYYAYYGIETEFQSQKIQK